MCEDMADIQPETGCRRIAMRAMLTLRVPLFLGCILFAADGALAQPTPIDLGTLGDSVTYPLGMNNRGDVGMFDLGALDSGATTAVAVNDRGQVVGNERSKRTKTGSPRLSRLPVDQAGWDGGPACAAAKRWSQ
jgi:hypothetical protein